MISPIVKVHFVITNISMGMILCTNVANPK